MNSKQEYFINKIKEYGEAMKRLGRAENCEASTKADIKRLTVIANKISEDINFFIMSVNIV